MPTTQQLDTKPGDVLVLAGTTKGLFLLRSNGARKRWELGGPHFAGQPIYATLLDQRRGRQRLFAGGGMPHWGPLYHWSDDLGRTWARPDKTPLRFPEKSGATLARIWQLQPGREPKSLYAGVEPSALFRSRDGGEKWALVKGLWNHPHREKWTPGGGGQCLHTVIPDAANPKRITIACSTGGVYRTDDGGATWKARNKGVRAQFLPDKHPEFGQCVHKVVVHPSRPQRLFLQNHWGLYRSDNGGDTWKDIANGVPSDFGFSMAMHPHDPDTVYIVPIESDEYRCTPEGKLRVYRTRDGGRSWEPLTRGLPQKNALELVLRDAMDVDTMNPAGVYFGTRRGSVYGSADGGNSWREIATGLPPVQCVRAAVIVEQAPARAPRKAVGKEAARKAKASARRSSAAPAEAMGRSRARARSKRARGR